MPSQDVILRLVIKSDGSQATKDLSTLSAQAAQFGPAAQGAANAASQAFAEAQKSVENLSKRLNDIATSVMGAGMALAGFGASLVAPMGAAVQQAGSLEHAMNKVRALAEATPAEFMKLTEHARQMGMTTVFSATQTAGGMLELARAGYKTEEVLSSVNTVLQLAAAEEQNVGDVAENLVNILKSFGMEATEAARAGDVLSRTSNDTTTSMASLAEGLKFVAPVAAAVGMSIEEVSAYMGVLSNNGLKGTLAGTGLRRMLAELPAPSEQAKFALHDIGVEIARNADNSVNLIETFRRLGAANLSTADAFKIFGVHGATEAVILSKNVTEIEKFTKRNQEAAGALKEMTDISQSGLVPALTRTGNAIRGLGETIGSPLLAPLKVVVNAFASLIGWVNNIAKAFPILTGILGGAAGIIGVAAVAIGGLMLAVGGAVMGAGALAKGWRLLVRVKQDGIGATLRSAAGIQAETATVQAETAAINANAQARQRSSLISRQNQDVIDRLNVPYLGNAGRTGAQPKGTPVPKAGQQPNLNVIEDATGKVAAFGNVNLKSALALGAVSGVLQGQVLPTIGTMGDAVTNSVTKVGELGTCMALLGPVAGTILSGMSSWFQVLTRDVWDLLEVWGLWENRGKQKTGASGSGGQEALARDLNVAEKFIKDQVALAGKGDSAKSSVMLTEFKKRWAEANPGVEFPKELESAFRKAYNNVVGVTKNALTQVGNEWEALNKKQVDNRTTEEKLTAVKAQYDLESKMLEASTKQKSEALKTEQETVKGNITAAIQSEQLRAVSLQGIENQYAAQRVALAQDTYTRTMAIRQAEYEQTKALLEKQRTDPESSAEKKKEAANKLIELDKTHTEASIAAGQKLTDSISQELDKQLQKRTEYEKKIQDLSTQSQDVQRSTAEALRSLQVGAASEYDALKMKLSDAQAKLREAAALMPTFPEKAMQLAKDAQTAFAGLGQNIDSLQQKMRTNAQAIADAQRAVATSGLTGAAKWQAEVENVGIAIQRAREEQTAGRTKEAEGFYKQAIQQAQGLAGSSDVDKGTAQATAQSLIGVAGKELLALNQQQIAEAKAYMAEAEKGIKAGGQLQLDGIKNQMDATKLLIVALNENTKALTGQRDAAAQKLVEANKPGEPAPNSASSTAQGGMSAGSNQGGVTGKDDQLLTGGLSWTGEWKPVTPKDKPVNKFADYDAQKAAFDKQVAGLPTVLAKTQLETLFAPFGGWTRANAPTAPKMLAYDAAAKQRMAADPAGEKYGLLNRAYEQAGRDMALDMMLPGGSEGGTSTLQGNIDSAAEAQASQGPQALEGAVNQFATLVGQLETAIGTLNTASEKFSGGAEKIETASNAEKRINLTVNSDQRGTFEAWSEK
jgi:TP901 family phage tail tape measure protein